MIPHLRKQFNQAFTEQRYQSFLDEIAQSVDHRPLFKIAETPVFIPKYMTGQLTRACEELVSVICRDDFKELSKGAMLPQFHVPGETEHAAFLSVDFGICRDENGKLSPQLIEIQGFPSLFCYQHICANAYRKHFNIPPELSHLFGNLDNDEYYNILRKVIIGDSKPENVVMIDVEPHKQNTLIDFLATEQALGLKVKCVSELKTEGRDVYYLDENGRKVGVDRIYNRVIFDELLKRPDLKRSFDFREEYDIRWVGHPNWFVRISKHTLPLFDSRFVPDSYYLNDPNLPGELDEYVLKPLYSFSGYGVILNPTQQEIDSIPESERGNYILQKKVAYGPVVETLDEPAKAEVRLMMAWEEDAPKPRIMTNLVRLSKGEMIGVRYNQGKTWVGGSVGFFEM